MVNLLASVYQKVMALVYRSGLERLEKFHPIRRLHRWVLSCLTPEAAEVHGNRMFLGPRDDLRVSIFGVCEFQETELVKREIKKGDVVLDLGSHIGYYTLLFAKLVGTEGKIFAFEPDPTNLALLKKNVEVNGNDNVVLVQKAVSDRTGPLPLYLSEENTGDHRIYDSHDGRSSIEVESVRLDDYFRGDPVAVNFIKMDIQGAEAAALQGMPLLLERSSTLKMLTEFWPVGLKRFGVEPEDYLKLLLRHRFKLYQVGKGGNRLEPTDLAMLLKTYTPKKENFTNLFCVRG